MKRFLSELLNPFLLSFWVTLLLLIIFPVRLNKFVATIIESGTYPNDQIVRYDDLDHDGNSERIAIFHNSIGTAGLTVANANGVLDQWTFRGRYDFVQRSGTLITGDRDGDGIKEINVFTMSGDSVLLHNIPDYRNPGYTRRNRLVSRVGVRDNKMDPFIIAGEMDDLTGDGCRELIFGIGTGYSLYPRNIFAYDAIHDTFLISPKSGYFIKGIIQEDLNGDHVKEIIPYGYAAFNIRGPDVPYPDSNSWLMVLNRELLFEFEPLSFDGKYSNLIPAVVKDELNKPVLAALYRPPENQGDSNQLMCFTPHGDMIQKLNVPGNSTSILTISNKKGRERLMLHREKSGIDLFDASLAHIRSVPDDHSGEVTLIDLNQDSIQEVIITDLYKRQLVVYQSELDFPVILPIDGDGLKGVVLSVQKRLGVPPRLNVQNGNSFLLFEYGSNPTYKLRWLIYAVIYLSILLFTWLVRKIQHDQFRRKQETERRITDLQLQIVRNQLDPHFIMNAINSIIVSITDKDKEEAKKQLQYFSRLHRALLLSSDQVEVSLHEEIEFTRNYLALEKFRFREKFDYDFQIDPLADLSIPLPKMILQVHVENALKHGILPLTRKGRLTLRVFPGQECHCVEITDNGVGRDYARACAVETTGKGLAVMEQYAELFNKYHPGRIAMAIEDLFDAGGNPDGTRIKITISGNHE